MPRYHNYVLAGVVHHNTGKTTAGASEAVWFALGTHPFRDIRTPNHGWAVSTTFEVQRDVSQPNILAVLPKSEIAHITNRTHDLIDRIELRNGSTISFKSCEQGRRAFEGASRRWIWFDEEPPSDIYRECQMRLLDTEGDCWGTMTPLLGLTWVYDVILQNKSEDREVWWEQVGWDDNPHLSPIERARLWANMDEAERASRVRGEFVALSGLVFPGFDPSVHVLPNAYWPVIPDDILPETIAAGRCSWRRLAGFDHGLSNPTAVEWAALDYDDRLWLHDEHYRAEWEPAQHAEAIRQRGLMQVWADPSTGNRTGPQGERVASVYAERGVTLLPANNTSAPVLWARERMRFERDPESGKIVRMPRLLIVGDGCPHLIDELRQLRWKRGATGQLKEEWEGADHAVDAMCYAVGACPPPPERPAAVDARDPHQKWLEDMNRRHMQSVAGKGRRARR